MKRSALWENCIQGASVLGICLLWYIAYAAVGNELVLPSPTACIKTVGELLAVSWFWQAFLATLLRVFLAFVCSLVLASGFALVSYLLPSFGLILQPIVRIFRALPTMAVLLLLLLWTGAEHAPVAVAFLSLFPMLYTSFLSALWGVDKRLIEMSRVYRVPLKTQVRELYIPSVLPSVVCEGAAAFGFAVKLVVSAEVLAGTFGSLGGAMQEARACLDIPLLFALTLVTLFVATVLEIATGAVVRRLV